jgi:dephospho-CoA kinase
MAKILGITGGMGSGKSTVSKIFEDLGCIRINSDELARFYTSEKSPLKNELKELLGEAIFDSSGNLDRKKIAAIVFNNKEKLDSLNSLIHPLVRRDLLEKIKTLPENTIVAWEAPLLFEAGGDKICDFTLTVFASEEKAAERVILRDKIPKEEFLARMRNQMDIKEKIKRSDFIIDNSSLSLLELKKVSSDILKEILK